MLMKKINWLRILRHFIIYLFLVLGYLYLYGPFNTDKENNPGSAIQFVYQQF